MTYFSSFSDDMTVAVIGASGGIGSAFIDHLIHDEKVAKIYAFSRSNHDTYHEKIHAFPIDITDENSIQTAADHINEKLDLIIVATGVLHTDTLSPEKSLRDLTMGAFIDSFTVNTFGPALIAKYFLPKIKKDEKSCMAVLSAKVGSISDNQIGGWYAYRAAKAALNALIKTTAIETARRFKESVILALHPGTVDTGLSKPFSGNVHHDIFTPAQSTDYMLNVINNKQPSDSGKLFSYNGEEILP